DNRMKYKNNEPIVQTIEIDIPENFGTKRRHDRSRENAFAIENISYVGSSPILYDDNSEELPLPLPIFVHQNEPPIFGFASFFDEPSEKDQSWTIRSIVPSFLSDLGNLVR